MMVCAEPGCNEPTETVGGPFSMRSWTSAGEGTVWFVWYTCLAGHRYMTEVFEEAV